MKRLFTYVVLVIISLATAAEPNAVIESALPLEGAIQAGAMSVVSQYLPDYGLQVNAFTLEGATEDEFNRETLVSLVVGLAATIRGLDSDDWVSVGFTRSDFLDNRTLLLVRVKQNQPETLEVWVNGERQ